jgi:hypothetical protein
MEGLRKHLKESIFACLICLFVSQSKGQVIIALLFGDKLNSDKLEFGLSGGLNLSNISNYYDGQTNYGFNLGLYLNWRLNQNWYLRAEAAPKFPTGASQLDPYSLHDANLDTLLRSGDVKRKIKNIALPILIRYRIKDLLFAEAGPQLQLRTKANDIFESGNLTYKNDIEDYLTRFDFGFAFGLSKRLNKSRGSMAIGVRYYFGFTDIDKVTDGAQKNRVFQLLANVPIGTGKQTSQARND